MKIRLYSKYSLLFFLSLTALEVLRAQIAEHPLQINPAVSSDHPTGSKTRAVKKLSLPFADDFSGSSGIPDPELWEDRQVFINNNLPISPPSVGVATFDGLDADGLPYGNGYGGSDTLTSKIIDLKNENSPYLTFFIQPKGIGYLPQIRDSLVVEGLNSSGKWVTLDAFEGLDDSYAKKDAPPFRRVSIILNTTFLHSDFQFRFRNYSPNRGLEALWHLDYVMLTRESQDLFVDDIAFTQQPAFLLNRYTAYPLAHLQNDFSRLNNLLPIHLRNNARDRYTIDTSRVEIYNSENFQTVFVDESLLEIPPIVPENQRNINPGPASFTNPFNIESVEMYLSQYDRDRVTLTTEYEYVIRGEKLLPTFKTNNRVQRQTTFDNYIAYDDNSIEGSISTYNGNGITTQIAIEYELTQSDSLHSVRIIFPYLVQNYEQKQFNLLIYTNELKTEPDFILKDLQPKRGNQFQPFTEYLIKDYLPEGILLPAGKFYIGWEHPRGTSKDYIPFGFDKNTPAANKYIYYNLGGAWLNVAESSPDLKGAIALRPVVGRYNLLSSADGAIEDLSHLLYPNPARHSLQIKTGLPNRVIRYRIYNIMGQLCKSGDILSYDEGIDIRSLSMGNYTLLLTEKDQTILGTMRFIKQ